MVLVVVWTTFWPNFFSSKIRRQPYIRVRSPHYFKLISSALKSWGSSFEIVQWCSQPRNLWERQPNITQKIQTKYHVNLTLTLTRLKSQHMGCKSFLQTSGYRFMVFTTTSQVQRFNTSQPILLQGQVVSQFSRSVILARLRQKRKNGQRLKSTWINIPPSN